MLFCGVGNQLRRLGLALSSDNGSLHVSVDIRKTMNESSRSGCAKQEYRLVFVADNLAQNKLLTDLSLLLSFLDNEFMLFCLLLSHLLAFDSLRILLAERQVGDGHICTISEGTTRLDSICKCHAVVMDSSSVCNNALYVSSNGSPSTWMLAPARKS